MPISYKIVKRGIPGVANTGNQAEAVVAVGNATLTPEDFLEKFSKKIRYPKAEIISLIYSLEALIIEELKNGNIIQTGPLGTFYPQVKCKGWKNKGANSNKIETDILYRPSSEMKREIKVVEVKRVE